jgi:hypothetical protein
MAGLPLEFSTDVENYVEKRAPAGALFPGRAEIARLRLGESVRTPCQSRGPLNGHVENGRVSAPGEAKVR